MRLQFLIVSLIATCTPCLGQSSSKEKLADSLYSKAKLLWNNNTDSAKLLFDLTLKVSRESHYLKGEANALKGLGYITKSNAEAIQYYTQALTIREKIKDSIGIGISLKDISDIYAQLGDREKALSYLNRSYEVRTKLNDYGGLAQCLIDFGKLELEKEAFDKALSKFKEALYYRKMAGEINGIAFAHINIAEVFNSIKKYDSSIYFAQLAKAEFKKGNNLKAMTWPICTIGECYFKLGHFDKALDELLSMDNKKFPTGMNLRQLKLLSEIYEVKKDYKEALYFQKQLITRSNENSEVLNNEDTRKLAADFEFKIRQLQLKQEEERKQADLNRHNNLQFLVIAIILIAIFIFIISLRGKVSERIANVLTFIGFLLLFEFLVVLFEPRFQAITKNEPFLILLGNVLIALVITPIHSVFERKFKIALLKKRNAPDQ